MAKKEMNNICYEIRQRWTDVVNIAIYHRLGRVPVKEANVVIAISSPHRQTSLEALPFALDELKKMVPIWKKEFYKTNDETCQESQWKENPECTWSMKARQLDNHNI
jgi:molybdopterin synthase catalytic subunit